MAGTSQAKSRGATRVTVDLELLEEGQKGAVTAYAFSASGKLIDSKPVTNGKAVLTVPAAKSARAVRVVVGPAMESDNPLAELLRRGATERFARLDPGVLDHRVEFTVPVMVWTCWFLSLCTVRGTLVKRIETGGLPVDLPVCNATVEIYEVDPVPVIVTRLPDDLLDRLRVVVRQPTLPFPPEPDPILPPLGPHPDPGPELRAFSLVVQPARVEAAAVAPEALRSAATFGGAVAFRRALVAHPDFTRALLCHLFPRLVTRHLLATATTDDCGHFIATFFRSCNNPDQPDLYFVAKQRIFPFVPAFTIYEPLPVACHTWWDYECGTEVTLVTTHPLARTCPPCQNVVAADRWVEFMAIGNVLLSHIHGTSEPLQATTDATNIGLTEDGEPFGGLLRPRLEFDHEILEQTNVRYYRISVGRQGDPNPISLDAAIVRHYTHEVAGEPVTDVYPLGPSTVGATANLFEIPPFLPPLGQWSTPDIYEAHSSGKWQTPMPIPNDDTSDTSGLYEIRVDLFDAAGNPANLAATGIHFVVPSSQDATGTIYTAEAVDLGLMQGNSFVMLVHVDNSACTATLHAPTLGGATANDCGVLTYTPGAEASSTVTMPYTAKHPHGFATRSFVLTKGGSPIYSEGGPVGVGSWSFTVTKTVGELLGGCPLAGFAEGLYVAAKATDGLRRLHEYDAAPPPWGFVLGPPEA